MGTTLVYPHHGAVTITDLTTRDIKGTPTKYMTLRVHSSDLVIQAAINKAADLGVRDVIDQTGVDKVHALLQAGEVEEAANWSRRFKDNQAKMISGDVYKVTEVVRDVWRREQASGISAGEKSMLSRARQILVSELALAQDTTTDDADTRLLEVLQTPTL
ncbi:CarD family transcriptional regulator [Frigoribacterium endophyticum]|nr:CarD family transcriptional regulator [Frigoribacterium endophyticum]